MTEPLHTVRFPGENDEYRRAREETHAQQAQPGTAPVG